MRRAAGFNPPNADAFRRLGQLYQQNGQFAEALDAYNEAQRMAPGDFRIYQDLANLHTAKSDYLAASKALERAVELAPDRPRLRTFLASSYQDQGRFPEAESALRAALELEASAANLTQLGHVLLYQERDADAIPLLTKATTLDSGDEFVWLYLGLACQRSGRAAMARNAFRRGSGNRPSRRWSGCPEAVTTTPFWRTFALKRGRRSAPKSRPNRPFNSHPGTATPSG